MSVLGRFFGKFGFRFGRIYVLKTSLFRRRVFEYLGLRVGARRWLHLTRSRVLLLFEVVSVAGRTVWGLILGNPGVEKKWIAIKCPFWVVFSGNSGPVLAGFTF